MDLMRDRVFAPNLGQDAKLGFFRPQAVFGYLKALEQAGQRQSGEENHDQSGNAGKICRQRRGVAGECIFKLLHLNNVLFVGLRHERAGSLLLPYCSQICGTL